MSIRSRTSVSSEDDDTTSQLSSEDLSTEGTEVDMNSNNGGGIQLPTDPRFAAQMELLSLGSDHSDRHSGRLEEIKTTPLFSAQVRSVAERIFEAQGMRFSQFGLLAGILSVGNIGLSEPVVGRPDGQPRDPRLFLNVNTPWSAFICGSQGSGKSHTLSCMLEDCLLRATHLWPLPNPLIGLVFHYDKFTSFSSGQVCEAAYLCSTGIPVRVLVSPSNVWKMQHAYNNMPNLASNAPKPVVIPLYFDEQQINIGRMMRLMAISEADGEPPLYMEVVAMILREMAQEAKGVSGFKYEVFQAKLKATSLTPAQRAPLNLRLALLESFLAPKTTAKAKRSRPSKLWNFPAGSLTIIDLSCPFVDESSACDLFDICLSIFLEQRGQVGTVVALDEAHKFMGSTVAADRFTDSLLSVIRLQRHLATRVIVSTQEPTISPKLLDLSAMTIVHRFTSPHWMATLKQHLAGAGANNDKDPSSTSSKIFEKIVQLDVGQALLFSPSAMVEATNETMYKLGLRFLRIKIRKRLTADGGRSVMAT
ncbi:MAG: hypothetical protein M1825_003778 [Sarcosagium campestre]|nr:MAG: hypothetical protein M1825_003778 [Sarcosagium campestre]